MTERNFHWHEEYYNEADMWIQLLGIYILPNWAVCTQISPNGVGAVGCWLVPFSQIDIGEKGEGGEGWVGLWLKSVLCVHSCKGFGLCSMLGLSCTTPPRQGLHRHIIKGLIITLWSIFNSFMAFLHIVPLSFANGKELKFHIDNLFFSRRKVMLESYIGRFNSNLHAKR